MKLDEKEWMGKCLLLLQLQEDPMKAVVWAGWPCATVVARGGAKEACAGAEGEV